MKNNTISTNQNRTLLIAILLSITLGVNTEAENRMMRCNATTEPNVVAWQNDLRAKLFKLLKMDDLVPKVNIVPLDAKEIKSSSTEDYTVNEMTIQSTPGRRIEIVMTIPRQGRGTFPAVVCIGGHSSTNFTVYTSKTYKCFASELAAKGYVTISTRVSQHKVYESDRTLMGERLWDLMRCVSYLESLPNVDKSHIGCGGLSLGGEMTMWLAAMDPRIAAADSCGFLTYMDQMEHNHCMCWKFNGLRELVDYPDIYALIAPRALECQNGRKEPSTQFTPELARKAMNEICPVYVLFGKADNAGLNIHDGGHEVDLPALLAFFDRHLKY
jgi:esterase/lipase